MDTGLSRSLPVRPELTFSSSHFVRRVASEFRDRRRRGPGRSGRIHEVRNRRHLVVGRKVEAAPPSTGPGTTSLHDDRSISDDPQRVAVVTQLCSIHEYLGTHLLLVFSPWSERSRRLQCRARRRSTRRPHTVHQILPRGTSARVAQALRALRVLDDGDVRGRGHMGDTRPVRRNLARRIFLGRQRVARQRLNFIDLLRVLPYKGALQRVPTAAFTISLLVRDRADRGSSLCVQLLFERQAVNLHCNRSRQEIPPVT